MTNRIALILGIILVALAVGDLVVFGPDHFIFLGKKFFELIEWIAFWR